MPLGRVSSLNRNYLDIFRARFFRRQTLSLHDPISLVKAVKWKPLEKRCKRKGLFHIFEIVMIVIVMFIMIFQLSSLRGVGSEWSKPKLMTQGRDMLFSMESAGVDWANRFEVERHLEYAFNNTRTSYRLELSGAPKKEISVGCYCPPSGCGSFCNDLRSLLESQNLFFNGFDVKLLVYNTDTINFRFDVIVTNNISFAGAEKSISNFVAQGKGFVLVKDLADQDFDDYGTILQDYFSLQGPVIHTGSGGVSFDLVGMWGDSEYYLIPRYFSMIPNGTGDYYNITNAFGSFSSDRAKRLEGARGFSVLKTSNNMPACVATTSASKGKGRTVWLSYDSETSGDWEVLLTSLVLWSSEHKRLIIEKDMVRESAKVSMYLIPDDIWMQDYMFRPMEIVLTMGYLY